MDCSQERFEARRCIIEANAALIRAKYTQDYHQTAVDNVSEHYDLLVGQPGWTYAKIGLDAAQEAEDVAQGALFKACAALTRAIKEYNALRLAEDIRNTRDQVPQADRAWARRAEYAAEDEMIKASGALARAIEMHDALRLAEEIRKTQERIREAESAWARREAGEEARRTEEARRMADRDRRYGCYSYPAHAGWHNFHKCPGGGYAYTNGDGNYYSVAPIFGEPPRNPRSVPGCQREFYEPGHQSRNSRSPSPSRSRQSHPRSHESRYQSRDYRAPSPPRPRTHESRNHSWGRRDPSPPRSRRSRRRAPSPPRSRHARPERPRSEPARPEPPAMPRIPASKLTEWKREADRRLADRATMTIFPDLPYAKCDECASSAKDRALRACQCIIEQALRNDPAYPASLKQERLRWHPDRFNLCPEARRDTFKAKAEEIFKVVNHLFEEEKKSREKRTRD